MHGTRPVESSYLTPSELGLTQEEFGALAWFVEQYDIGKIKDAELDDDEPFPIKPIDGETIPQKFLMKYVMATVPRCGTAGCILGWIAHRLPKGFDYPWPLSLMGIFTGGPTNANAADARNAVVRVLTGNPPWPTGLAA